jgi:regulator of replication initiation timing
MNPQMKEDIINLFVKSGTFDSMNEKQQKELLNAFNSVYIPQDRRQYNEDYYYFNSDEIKKEKNSSLVCLICGDSVNKSNMARHRKTQVCKLKGELIVQKGEITRLKKNLEETREEVVSLKNENSRIKKRIDSNKKYHLKDIKFFRNIIKELCEKVETLENKLTS